MENQDFEHVLISIWLQGKCLEYLGGFDEADFTSWPHVFKALKQTDKPDLLKISRLCGEKFLDLAQLVSDYGWSCELFPSAFRIMSNERIHRLASEYASKPYDVAEFTRRLTDASNNFIVADENFDLASKYLEFLDAKHQAEKIFYGIACLDRITGGQRPKELTIIAARPGNGKTAFALQIAVNAAQNHTVAFFSLEMDLNQITERIICRYSDIPALKLKNPDSLSPDEWVDLNSALNQIPKQLKLVQNVRTLEGIRLFVEKHSPSLVIIDQLSHIRTRDFKSIRDRYVYLTNAIKSMAVELDIPIILLAQINRSGQDRMPSLADLKESGSLEEDADQIFIIHKLLAEDCQNSDRLSKVFDYAALERNGRTPIILNLAKHRNGELKRFPMCYHGKRFIFEEIS